MAKPIKDTSIFLDIKNLQNELLLLRRNLSRDSLEVWRKIIEIVSIDAFGLFYRTHGLLASEEKVNNIRDLYVKFRVVENCMEIIVGIENTSTEKLTRVFGEYGQVKFIEILAKLQKACDNWEDSVKDELRKQLLKQQ
jgi:hypothetical protein